MTSQHVDMDVPTIIIAYHDYGCDRCNNVDAKQFYKVRHLKNSFLLLCPSCFMNSDWNKNDVVEIYKVVDDLKEKPALWECIQHYIKQNEAKFAGITFTYWKLMIHASISITKSPLNMRQTSALLELFERFHLTHQFSQTETTVRYLITRNPDPNPNFELLKKAFDLLQDKDKLEDVIASMTPEEWNALYDHPILNDYDLLP